MRDYGKRAVHTHLQNPKQRENNRPEYESLELISWVRLSLHHHWNSP
eukprot:Gb_06381 [translate_table: standard]